MKKYDELIKEVAIIVVGIIFIYLVSYIADALSLNPGPSDLPPPPPLIDPTQLPSPEEILGA